MQGSKEKTSTINPGRQSTFHSFPRPDNFISISQARASYARVATDANCSPKLKDKFETVDLMGAKNKLKAIHEEIPEPLPIHGLPCFQQSVVNTKVNQTGNGIQIEKLKDLHTASKNCITPSYSHSVPTFVKEKLVKQIKGKRNAYNDRPVLGIVAYVGSPVNGDMIVGNPDVVDDWLTYIKVAQQQKVLDVREGVLKIADLEKLCNISILPGTRHEFTLKYEVHPELRCAEHKHDKRMWESATYPCTIISCKCITHQGD
jgi:hypothetical protein